MTKSIELLKKAVATLVSTAFVLGLLFVVSCDESSDDPEPEPYDLTGVYVFNEAILQTQISIPTAIGTVPIPAGTNVTQLMASGLLAEAPCTDPANGAVELKSGGKLFFACVGESTELDAGTWAVNEARTELTLNLAVAIGDLALILTDLEIDEDNDIIGGSIANFPITKSLMAGFPGVDLSQIPEDYVLPVDLDIKFEKVV